MIFQSGQRPDAETYTIVIPPPNVTGMLHIGHALDFTLQDILIRTKRMQGYDALVAAGNGPCGNCHPNKSGAEAARGRQSRYDLGREKFLGEGVGVERSICEHDS